MKYNLHQTYGGTKTRPQATVSQTRRPADTEGPCDVPQVRNIAHEKACNRGMTFKDTQAITIAAIR